MKKRWWNQTKIYCRVSQKRTWCANQVQKTWRAKEQVQNLIRKTSGDSYYNLSKWLFMVEEKNTGPSVYWDGKFKYAFVVFGPSIMGFALMRRVIVVDGTFSKWKFKRFLLGANAQDGNFNIYQLAF